MGTNIVREFDKKISDETIVNIPRKKTYDEIIDELEEENENLASNTPWSTTEQATEIQVTDAAKYSKNKLELFSNTYQVRTRITDGDEYDSPSADYPQDIHKVTGIIKTKIASENFFNIKQNYVVGQFNNDGTINTNIKANVYVFGSSIKVVLPNNNPSGWISDLIEFTDKDEYILSFSAVNNMLKVLIAEYDENEQFIQSTSVTPTSSRQILFQATDNTKYIRFVFENITNSYSNTFTNIQFRKGTTIKDYEEYYNEQIELNFEDNTLANVGTTEDIPFKNTIDSKYYNRELTLNSWYIYSQCVFKIFDGTEGWKKGTSTSETTLLKAIFVTTTAIPDIEQVNFNYAQQGLCNIGKLGDAPARSYTGYNREGVSVGTKTLYVCYKKFEDMSVEEFKEYLHENPIVILCKRATPAYIPLTNQNLVKNLDKIYEHLKLVKGTNNITITAEDLPPKMQLTYMQDLPSRLDKLEAMILETNS